jgi:hypothetical protein
MGAIKNYMMELADKKGVDFEDITDEDIEMDFYNKAQMFFANENSTKAELEAHKMFLPKKNIKEVSYYNAETGTPKFKVGDIMVDGDFTFYLIVE